MLAFFMIDRQSSRRLASFFSILPESSLMLRLSLTFEDDTIAFTVSQNGKRWNSPITRVRRETSRDLSQR